MSTWYRPLCDAAELLDVRDFPYRPAVDCVEDGE